MSATAGQVAGPIVSVVITNHDYGRFVGQAIDSALGQAVADVEVIVVDDGSTDGSADVIAAYEDRITAVFTANGGQGAAFNAAWPHVHGEIVIFLDADDVLHPQTAARVVRAFAAGDTELSRVHFPLTVIDDVGRPTGETIPGPSRRLVDGEVLPMVLRCPDDIAWQPTSGNAFARRALDAIMPVPEAEYRICADYYLSNLTAVHGPVRALDAPGGGYRVHGDNGHYANTQTIDALRANVVRTSITHRWLIDQCRRRGLSVPGDHPDAVRSVSATANRLVSLRIDPARHPIATDTRSGLLRLGIRSAAARHDVGVLRRLTFGLWFAVAAICPAAVLHVVIRPYVRLVRDTSGVLDEPGEDQDDHHDGHPQR